MNSVVLGNYQQIAVTMKKEQA